MKENNESLPGITFTGSITVNGPMFDIHDNQQVTISTPGVKPPAGGTAANNHDEEFFRFIHPEIGDDEAWRIHQAVKRLVTTQKVAEICSYLHELKKTGKVLLPQNPRVMYEELKKLGMPDGDGYTFGHFRNKYLK